MTGIVYMPLIGTSARPRTSAGVINGVHGGALSFDAITGKAAFGGFAAGNAAFGGLAVGEAVTAPRPAPRAPWVDDRELRL